MKKSKILLLYTEHGNWFYEDLARRIHEDLGEEGYDAALVPAERFLAGVYTGGPYDLILLTNLCEIIECLRFDNERTRCLERILTFPRRVLLNCDAFQTYWYRRQFRFGPGVFSEVLDLGVIPQNADKECDGVPIHWAPESFTRGEFAALEPWSDDRPVPWAFMGHLTLPRVLLVCELQETLGRDGFVLIPPLAPYTKERGGLSRETLFRVLKKSRFYIWNSHHPYPYHETLRVMHAVANGAMPVKIDATGFEEFQGLPWVFQSLEGFLEQVASQGRAQYYRNCLEYMRGKGTLGRNVAEALGLS